MRCRDVQQKLDLHAGGELAPSEREAIEVHARHCEGCRQELDRLRRLKELLASAPAPSVPEGFAARVVARARRDSSPEHRAAAGRAAGQIGRRLRIAASTAAALAAGLLLGASLGFDTWQGDRPPGGFGAGDPLAGSGLGQFVEPGGDDSLAQAYLTLISGGGDG